MNRTVVGVLGALFVVACQTPASAQTVKISASGVVGLGAYDATGVFGAPGQSLAGDPFSFTATFNIAKAGYFTNGQRSDIYGGQAYSYLPYDPPSLGGGAITINGVSQTVHGQWNSWLFAGYGATISSDFQFVQDYVNTSSFYENSAVLMNETPAFGLFSFPNYTMPSGNLCSISDCSSSNFSFNESVNGVVTEGAYGNLTPSDITVTVTPAPEPASWALMLAGFAGLGAAIRSGRGRAAATA